MHTIKELETTFTLVPISTLTEIEMIFAEDPEFNSESMDYMTSDETGTEYFQDKHSQIINDHFNGEDWCWEEVIKYWDIEDLSEANEVYDEIDL